MIGFRFLGELYCLKCPVDKKNLLMVYLELNQEVLLCLCYQLSSLFLLKETGFSSIALVKVAFAVYCF